MMAMLDAIDDGGQLAAHPAVQASAEDLGYLVPVKPPTGRVRSCVLRVCGWKVRLKMKLRNTRSG